MPQESRKLGGFFSRMLHRVRGDTPADAADLLPDDASTPYSRQALTQMVERKRRNDAIRTQEFAELRQLRRQGAAMPGPAAVGVASAFLPSVLESDVRAAHTLQKINAIEAQMAQQWWRHPVEAAVSGGVRLPADAPVAGAREPARSASAASSTAAEAASALVTEQPALVPPGMAPVSWDAIPTLGLDCMVESGDMLSMGQVSSRGGDFFTSPGVEEAAILWAQGDLDGAQARLLALLVQALDQQPADAVAVAGVWHAVLDVYAALGDEEGFEPLAIDYAAHFGRSAPVWRSLPAQLGAAAWGQAPRPVAWPTELALAWWHVPAVLTGDVVARWQAAPSMPEGLDWSRLERVDAPAAPALARLLEQWSQQGGTCQVADAARWLALLEAQTPAGDAHQAPIWWALHMAALRWLNRPSAFEQVALDYCVTYEVSPPSWVPPLCECADSPVPAQPASWSNTVWAPPGTAAEGADPPAAWAVLVPPTQPATPALAGVIEGAAQAWLQSLQAHARLGRPLDIACADLIRLDFVAAGSLLNWAAEMQAQGHVLRFTQLHHVVAVFLQVIGMPAHAALHPRAA